MSKGKKKHRKTAIILAVIASLIIAFASISPTIKSTFSIFQFAVQISDGATADQILEQANEDPRGYRIDALEDYGEDESWAIYIYMVGSNLESGNVNTLSDLTKYLIADEVEKIENDTKEHYYSLLRDFTKDIEEAGMDLPRYFFNPMTPAITSDQENQDTVLEYYACGSYALNQIRSAKLNDNITFVIQTGGANAWSDLSVNPNRSERFVADSNGFRKVESNPIVNMATPESLSSFLTFCKEGYDADHKMIVLWNHGSSAFGYGHDEVFDQILSLKDIKKAFSDVYGESPEDAPFDIIGFSACLMSSVETVNELYEYSDYLVASEEVLYLPPGWDFEKIINKLLENPNMHAEKLAKEIVDSSVEDTARSNIEDPIVSTRETTAIAVVNMEKGKKVYDAYLEFAKAVLLDSTKDLSVLANISKAGRKAIAYGLDDYNLFNALDLKTFMEAASEYYPNETKAVLDSLEEAVLYERGTYYGNNSGGLSVYYPLNLNSVGSILYTFLYINDVTDEDVLKALYYYKLAGTLNDEYANYAKSIGAEEIAKLDTSALEELANANVEIENNTIKVPISLEQYSFLQHAEAALALIDGDNAINLGSEGNIMLSEDAITMDLNGYWINASGNPLPIKYISSNDNLITYSSHVLYKGKDSYLILTLDLDSGTVVVNGVRDAGEADSDAVIAERMIALSNGDEFTPIYEVSDLNAAGIGLRETNGDRTYRIGRDRISYSPLRNGSYIMTLSGFDFRGDEYFTPTLSFSVSNGNITDLEIDESYKAFLVN